MARWEDVLHQQHLLWRLFKLSLSEGQGNPAWDEKWERLADRQRVCMATADPVWIASDIQDVVEAAVADFEQEPFLASDFFAPAGFMVLARPAPMYGVANFGEAGEFPIPSGLSEMSGTIDAFAWQPHPQGCELTLYGRKAHPTLVGLNLTPLRNSVVLPFGVVAQECWTGHSATWRYFQVTLKVAQQRLAAHTRQQLPRGLRRDLHRRGELREAVTVITLRKAKAQRSNEEGRAVDYSCRWLVRPHWRNQWYPSLGEHRQKLILGYVKGPDDKELRVTQRAFEVVR